MAFFVLLCALSEDNFLFFYNHSVCYLFGYSVKFADFRDVFMTNKFSERPHEVWTELIYKHGSLQIPSEYNKCHPHFFLLWVFATRVSGKC